MRAVKSDIDERKDDLAEAFDADPAFAKAFWEKLDLSWTYHELGLEGVVVTPEEMELALRPTLPPVEVTKGKFLLEIRRQRYALEVIKEEARNPRGKVSMGLIKRFYEVFTGDESGKIDYRAEMPLHRTYFHDIAPPGKILPELAKLVEWAQSSEYNALHPLQQVSVFHHRLLTLFPWTDYTGKIGRSVMNVCLLRAGYLPAVMHTIDRQRYFESFKQPPAVLQRVVTEAIEHVTEHAFRFMDQPAQKQSRAGNY